MNKYKLTYDSEVFGSKTPERLSFVIEADSFDEAYEFLLTADGAEILL